jgi:hypothetical protein
MMLQPHCVMQAKISFGRGWMKPMRAQHFPASNQPNPLAGGELPAFGGCALSLPGLSAQFPLGGAGAERSFYAGKRLGLSGYVGRDK